VTCAFIVSGRKICAGRPSSMPEKPSGATPTIVYGTALTTIGRPTTAGSPPKRVIQKVWLRTASAGAPGVPSSPGSSVRPAAGARPSVWKYAPETSSAATRSVCPSKPTWTA
jgi:hypothetical protein